MYRLNVTGTMLVFLTLSFDANAAEFSHSWVSLKFAPCEGVGATGSFRVHVSGTITPKQQDGSRTITALSVHASSAAFTQGEGSVASKAIIKRQGAAFQEVALTRPAPPAVEAATKSDETRRVYLPTGKTISIAEKAEFVVWASAVVKTPAGVCALGSSEESVKLP